MRSLPPRLGSDELSRSQQLRGVSGCGALSLFFLALMPSSADAQVHTTRITPVRPCYVIPASAADDYQSVCQRAGYWRLHGSNRRAIKAVNAQDLLAEAGARQIARKSDDARLISAVALLIGDNDPSRQRGLKTLMSMANSGNTFAIHNVGSFYFGVGGDQGYQKAAYYYANSAETGFSQSLNMAGYMYLRGWGVKQNFAAARSYFSAASQKGNVASARNLGLMYSKSFFGIYDIQKSIAWYKTTLESEPFDASSRICSVLSDQTESPVAITPSELTFKQYIWCSIASRLADDALASSAMIDDEDKEEIWSAQSFARQMITGLRKKYSSQGGGAATLKKGDQIVQSCILNGVHKCNY